MFLYSSNLFYCCVFLNCFSSHLNRCGERGQGELTPWEASPRVCVLRSTLTLIYAYSAPWQNRLCVCVCVCVCHRHTGQAGEVGWVWGTEEIMREKGTGKYDRGTGRKSTKRPRASCAARVQIVNSHSLLFASRLLVTSQGQLKSIGVERCVSPPCEVCSRFCVERAHSDMYLQREGAFIFIYLHVLMYSCLYVCTYVCVYVYVKCV